jgi:hypothetical protein
MRPPTGEDAPGESEAAAEDETAAESVATATVDGPPNLEESLGLSPDGAAETEAAEAADAEAAEAETAEAADVAEDALPRLPRQPRSAPETPRRSMAGVLSLFLLLLLLVGAGSAAFFMRQEIMMWMPATQRLYALAGLAPEALGEGLRIVEPTPKKEVDGNDEILVVEGAVRNIAGKPLDIPLMRGALLDKQGKELHIWTFTAAKSRIGPGEEAAYRTEFRNPPNSAESLDITFTRGGARKDAAKRTPPLEASVKTPAPMKPMKEDAPTN